MKKIYCNCNNSDIQSASHHSSHLLDAHWPCLIGDEMGLGKTIQAIAAAEILARLCGVTRVLVICPTSLKYQWQQEIARFAGREGDQAARVIAGGRAQRQKQYAVEDFCKITNYGKIKPDLDLITAWAPELVIVDEADELAALFDELLIQPEAKAVVFESVGRRPRFPLMKQLAIRLGRLKTSAKSLGIPRAG